MSVVRVKNITDSDYIFGSKTISANSSYVMTKSEFFTTLAFSTLTDANSSLVIDDVSFNEISITDFGAVGDGLTDNTEALQNAFDFIAKNGGGNIIIPPGVFVTGNVTCTASIIIVGIGRESSYIKSTGTFTVNGSTDITFKNLSFVGDTANNNLVFIDCDYVNIYDCGFYKSNNAVTISGNCSVLRIMGTNFIDVTNYLVGKDNAEQFISFGNNVGGNTVEQADVEFIISEVAGSAKPMNEIFPQIIEDNKVTISEKLTIATEWQLIQREYSNNLSAATNYEIETASYQSSYNTLENIITPILSNLTVESILAPGVAVNFQNAYDDYNLENSTILGLIEIKINDNIVISSQFISDAASDDIITSLEKQQIYVQWQNIAKEKLSFDSEYATYYFTPGTAPNGAETINTDLKTKYDLYISKFNSLNTHLNTTVFVAIDINGNSHVNGSILYQPYMPYKSDLTTATNVLDRGGEVFKTKFTDYFTARANLQIAILNCINSELYVTQNGVKKSRLEITPDAVKISINQDYTDRTAGTFGGNVATNFDNIYSDSILTPNEKQLLLKEWEFIAGTAWDTLTSFVIYGYSEDFLTGNGNYLSLVTQATTYLSGAAYQNETLRTALFDAGLSYSDLHNYLLGPSGIIVNMTTTQSYNPAELKSYISNYNNYANILSSETIKASKGYYNAWFNFDTNGLTIGKTNSAFTTLIDNTELAFRQKNADGIDEAISWINGNVLHITKAEIQDRTYFGLNERQQYDEFGNLMFDSNGLPIMITTGYALYDAVGDGHLTFKRMGY